MINLSPMPGPSTIMGHLVVVGLTVIGAWADAWVFVCADRVWERGHLSMGALSATVIASAVGLTAYLLVLRELSAVADISVSVQAIGWLVITVVGVAATSPEWSSWSWPDRLLAMTSVTTLALLVWRTA